MKLVTLLLNLLRKRTVSSIMANFQVQIKQLHELAVEERTKAGYADVAITKAVENKAKCLCEAENAERVADKLSSLVQ